MWSNFSVRFTHLAYMQIEMTAMELTRWFYYYFNAVVLDSISEQNFKAYTLGKHLYVSYFYVFTLSFSICAENKRIKKWIAYK